MLALIHIFSSLRDFLTTPFESDALQTALAASRQEDGSLAFDERSYLNLPTHDRDAYLRRVRIERAVA